MSLLGSDLQFLAGVSELSKLDLEPSAATLGLLVQDGRIIARFVGAYNLGERFIDYDGEEFACEVNAERFAGLASLFPSDKAVSLLLDKHTLTVKSTGANGRELSLQTQRNEVSEVSDLDTVKPTTSVKIKLEDLRKESELAKQFIAKNFSNVLLTGINLDVDAKSITISAFDTMSLFVTEIEPLSAKKGSEPVNCTVADKDLELGLKVMGTGEATLEVVFAEEELESGIEVVAKRVRLVGSTARFSLPTLYGNWPDLDEVMRYKKYAQHVDVPGPALRDAVSGLKALSPNYAKSRIEIVSDDRGRLLIQTRQAEHGRFEIRAGKVEGDNEVNFSYSASSMSLAASLGDVLTFDIPSDSQKQTRVSSGVRTCWISATAE